MTTFTYIPLHPMTPSHRQLSRIFAAVWLFLALVATMPAAKAQSSAGQGAVAAVDAIGMTVADMDRAVEFYTQVLAFEKVSDVEVAGTEYERLQGVFGLRMRV